MQRAINAFASILPTPSALIERSVTFTLSFNKIENKAPANIVFTQGNATKVEADGPDNYIPQLIVMVKDSTLSISMATKRVLPDKDFDRIIVRTHKLARNVTMRVKPDGLHVTVPPYSLSSKVLEVVEQYRQRLLEDWRKVSKKPIDLNFRIHTPCFRLWLEQGNFTCFSVRFTEEGVKIICPRNVDFSLPEVQRLVRNAIIRAMKKNAQEYLPPLLSALSEQLPHLPLLPVIFTRLNGK